MRFYDASVGFCHLTEGAIAAPSSEIEPGRYSARFNQFFEIVQISIDPTGDGAAEARGQLKGQARALVR